MLLRFFSEMHCLGVVILKHGNYCCLLATARKHLYRESCHVYFNKAATFGESLVMTSNCVSFPYKWQPIFEKSMQVRKTLVHALLWQFAKSWEIWMSAAYCCLNVVLCYILCGFHFCGRVSYTALVKWSATPKPSVTIARGNPAFRYESSHSREC